MMCGRASSACFTDFGLRPAVTRGACADGAVPAPLAILAREPRLALEGKRLYREKSPVWPRSEEEEEVDILDPCRLMNARMVDLHGEQGVEANLLSLQW